MNLRHVIKIAGESGQGINLTGDLLAKSLRDIGYHVFGYREYPSLIKGGFSSYQIDIGEQEIRSSRHDTDMLICMSRLALHAYLGTVSTGGLVLHSNNHFTFTAEETKLIERKQLRVHYIDAIQLTKKAGGSAIQVNALFAGLAWQILDMPLEALIEEIRRTFADKSEYIGSNTACAQVGFEYRLAEVSHAQMQLQPDQGWKNSLYIKGNNALALAAVASGVRAFFGYPMTPSSSILSSLAEWASQTGMVVKQAEDEITAAQMAVGAMFAGTRALTATSGGGFDLMTETLSLAGITETPFVCILGQRPGPATGMPTWTAASDLNLALYSGHGEFPRLIVAASDAPSCFQLLQECYNFAEQYQLPVILLTDKFIAESDFNTADLGPAIAHKRGLLSDQDLDHLKHDLHRYQITPSGVSQRWLPGQSLCTYVGNSDEHDVDGNASEEADVAVAMQQKRMRKMLTLKNQLPEPQLVGDYQAPIVIVSWGSTLGAISDALQGLEPAVRMRFQHLHYSYIYPVRTSKLEALRQSGKKFVLIENNFSGQLGKLLQAETRVEFARLLLKYDGRPFFCDEIAHWLANLDL